MKLNQLFDLTSAAELGADLVVGEYQRANTRAAITAAHTEYSRRLAARKLYRQTRPAQTVTRKLIRQELLTQFHKTRLTRSGQWQVLLAAGQSWQLIACSDLEAQEFLVDLKKEKNYADTQTKN